MADFNIQGEIDLQLADNAAEKLTNKLKSVKPTVSVKVVPEGIADLKKDLKDLTSESYDLKISVPKGVAASLRTLNRDFKALYETLAKFDANGDVAKALLNLGAAGQQAAKQVSTINVRSGTVKDIQDLEKALGTLSKKPNAGSYIPFLNKELKDLIGNYNDIVRAESLAAGKSGRGNQKKAIEKLLSDYKGLNGKSATNVVRALNDAFNALSKLDIEAEKLRSKGLLTSENEAQINNTRKAALDLLKTLDASNSATFGTSLNRVIEPALSKIRDTNNEAKQYRKLLSSISKEEQIAIQTGANQNVIDAIRSKRAKVQELKTKGVRVEDIKNDPAFIETTAISKNIGNAEKLAQGLTARLNKAANAIGSSAFFDKAGSQSIDLTTKVTNLISESRQRLEDALKINDSTLVRRIQAINDQFGLQLTELKDKAKEIDSILRNLFSKQSYYDAANLPQSSAAVNNIISEVTRLASIDTSSSDINNFLTKQSGALEVLTEKERKLSRLVNVVDRLRSSLQGGLSTGQDKAGVGDALDDLQNKISSTSLENFDERALKKIIGDDSYLIRYKAKFNKLINDSINKFSEASFNTDATSIVGKAYREASQEFQSIVSNINIGKGSFEDLSRATLDVNEAFHLTFGRAQTAATGGFFGAFSKAAGLAVKRLSAFLIAAQGLYAVQNLLSSAAQSVVTLDSEFVRLEQIFAGSAELVGSVAENTDRLSSKILKLGRSYGVATTQIAESADILAQADIRGPDLDRILEVATKARLGPTFKSNIEITEALIAAMNQFNLTARDSEDIIGGISQVSAQFAVESEGITAAIRRAGGAFSAGRGAGIGYREGLANFIGLFSVLKQETREADETLATSLRNILTRIQRTNVQKFLKDRFQIDFLDDDNQFIGPIRALEAVRAKLDELGIQSTDPRFAEVVEKLAGARQTSRLTSLLNGLEDVNKVIKEFGRGGEILDRDVGIAFQSIENKIERAKNAVIELFTVIGRSEIVKALIELFTTLTNVVTGLVTSLDSLSVTLAALANLGSFVGIASSIIGKVKEFAFVGPGLASNAFLAAEVQKRVGRAATGGIVPGIGPNIDTEPYLLAKGEYVVNKHSVRKYGKGFFDLLNSGKINKAADGTGAGGLLSGNTTAVSGLTNGLDDLIDALKKMGVTVDNITDVVKSFGTAPELVGAGGTFNYKTRSLQADKSKLGSRFLLGHELGHAFDAADRKGLRSSFYPTKEQIAFTKNRLAQTPELYGKKPSKSTLQKEVLADIFGKYFSRGGSSKNPKEQEVFNKLARYLESRGNTVAFEPRGGGPLGPFRPLGSGGGAGGGGGRFSVPGFPYLPGGSGGGGGALTKTFKDIVSTGKSLVVSKFGFLAALAALAPVLASLISLNSASKEFNESVLLMAKAATSAAVSMFLFSQATKLGSLSDFFKNIKFDFLPKQQGPQFQIPELTGRQRAFRALGVIDRTGLNGRAYTQAAIQSNRAAAGPSVLSGASKIFQVFALAAIGASAALNVFADASIESANKVIDNATIEDEVRRGLSDRRQAEQVKKGSNVLGNIGKGAAIGGGVGSIIPGVGTALGSIAGALLGGLYSLRDGLSGIFDIPLIAGLASVVTETLQIPKITSFVKSVGSGIYDFFEGVGNFVDSLKSESEQLADRNTKKNEDNLAFLGANLAGYKESNSKNSGGIEASKSIQRAISNLNDVIIFNDDDRIKGKEGAESLKKVLEEMNSFQRSGVIEAAQKAGIDISKVFDRFGVEFNAVDARAQSALSKLSKFLLGLERYSKILSNRISSRDVNAELINRQAGFAQGENVDTSTPAAIFELLRSGGRISGQAQQFVNRDLASLARFDGGAAANAVGEIAGSRAISEIINDIAGNDIKLGGSGGPGGFAELEVILAEKFADSIRGLDPNIASTLNKRFEEYIESQESAFGEIAGGTNVDGQKLADVLNGFTDVIQKGSIDLLEQYSASEAAYREQLNGAIQKRIDFENKATDYLLKNVENTRAQFDIFNKSVNQEGTRNQAQFLDQQQFALLLKGTGLGATTDVNSIRQRFDQVRAGGPENNNIRSNLVKALETIAGGTNEFTYAIKEFEKASEKAKRTTEEFTGALLGSDDELINQIKGITAFQSVTGAKDQGQAFLRLQNLSETERASLRNFAGGDQDRTNLLNRSLGIGTDITATPEAQAADAAINQQIAANIALAEIQKGLADVSNQQAQALINNAEAIKGLGVQINSFGQQFNEAANKIGNMPTNVVHDHKFTVSPIQVNITGADGLKNLEGAVTNIAQAAVTNQINKFAENLKAENKGLTVSGLAVEAASAVGAGSVAGGVINNTHVGGGRGSVRR